MSISMFFVSAILSIFSTTVMGYIAMATPIGPWIAPTLVLVAFMLFACLGKLKKITTPAVALVVSAGSIGGILATGCGFYFPTLFFLDEPLFMSWMHAPLFFAGTLGSLAFLAGMFGLLIADFFEQRFLAMEFPIGQLVYKMIDAKDQLNKTWQLAAGVVATTVFCAVQDGMLFGASRIPKSVTLLPAFSWYRFAVPALALDLWPLLWSIGFITGHMIAVPLAVGAASKILLVDQLNLFLFPTLSGTDFLLAFCSGMMVVGAIGSCITVPFAVVRYLAAWWRGEKRYKSMLQDYSFELYDVAECTALLAATSLFLWYFNFSWLFQIYLIAFTGICTYQILLIAGKLGLAPMGRFATFVMAPALLLFNVDMVQLTIISTYVGVAIGVATDVLFGRKIAQLAGIGRAQIKKYQLFGLLMSSVAVGIVFWLLINHFTLGSPELFAQRAQARRLLIHAGHFNLYVLVLGALFGQFLSWMRINPMLVFGGLLMPLNFSLGLIVGALASWFVRDKEAWYPWWSGVFAAQSVWMLIRTLL